MAGLRKRGSGMGFIDPATAMLISQGVQMGIDALMNRQSGKQKVGATNIVNAVAAELQKNVDAFLAAEPKTPALKSLALSVFEGTWKQMVQALSDPALGKAGQRGLEERSRGGVYDFWEYYYDPIMDTPVEGFTYQTYLEQKMYGTDAQTLAQQGGGMNPSVLNKESGSGLLLLLGAGVIVYLVMQD